MELSELERVGKRPDMDTEVGSRRANSEQGPFRDMEQEPLAKPLESAFVAVAKWDDYALVNLEAKGGKIVE